MSTKIRNKVKKFDLERKKFFKIVQTNRQTKVKRNKKLRVRTGNFINFN